MTIKVFHVISSLKVGGAQRLLEVLANGLRRPDFEHTIIGLTRETQLASDLRAAGHRVYCLGVDYPAGLIEGVFRTARLLRAENAHVVHTWLYHADLVGGIAATLCGSRPIIWSIHHASADLGHDKFTTRWLVRLLSKLSSHIPEVVTYCSKHASAVHESLGYLPPEKIVIENGIDTARFCPSRQLRWEFRREVEVPEDVPTIGFVARYVPIKGVDVFLQMAKLLCVSIKNPCFVMVGTGLEPGNTELVVKINALDLGGAVRLLGERGDTERVMNGLDLVVCSSFAESFGLVVAEALACGVPVVASDIDVLREMVGDYSTVTIGDCNAFAEKAKELLALSAEERTRVGREGRSRIIENWSADNMLVEYATLYRNLAGASVKLRGREAS